jgi:hypothetical protein
MIGGACDTDRNGDSRSQAVVRAREKVTAYGGAQTLRNVVSRGCRRAQQRDELVSTRVRDQLALAQIRARQIEDRTQHRFSVWLTKLVSNPSIVIDVSYKQGIGGEPRRPRQPEAVAGVDEGVEGGEPSLLIEKRTPTGGARVGRCPALRAINRKRRGD